MFDLPWTVPCMSPTSSPAVSSRQDTPPPRTSPCQCPAHAAWSGPALLSVPFRQRVQRKCRQLPWTPRRISFAASMKAMWELPWKNERKGTFWPLSISGVRADGTYDIVPPAFCPCGRHNLPPGLPLRSGLTVLCSCRPMSSGRARWQQQSGLQCHQPCRRRHNQLPCSALWLQQVHAGIHGGVMSVAAVQLQWRPSIEWGRRYLWSLSQERELEEDRPYSDTHKCVLPSHHPSSHTVNCGSGLAGSPGAPHFAKGCGSVSVLSLGLRIAAKCPRGLAGNSRHSPLPRHPGRASERAG